MEWLNYHHLFYFWTVAREGSIARACEPLHLAQPTISAQLRTLERSLGVKLFERRGRGLALTEAGRLVYRYADEIFGVGRELQDTLKGRPAGRPLRLAVGVADAMPKLVAYHLLEPALRTGRAGPHGCLEGKPGRCWPTSRCTPWTWSCPTPRSGREGQAFSHQLGECGVSCWAAGPGRGLAGPSRPRSTAPRSSCRPRTRRCAARSTTGSMRGVRPDVVGEFEDRP